MARNNARAIDDRFLKHAVAQRSWEGLKSDHRESAAGIEDLKRDLEVDLAAVVRFSDDRAKILSVERELNDGQAISGLRPTVLQEAVYLSRKAWTVASCSQKLASSGYWTWGLSNAYHASQFAAKSIMRFLGVSTFELENRSFVVDLFAAPGSVGKRSQRDALRTSSYRSCLWSRCKRIENRHVWDLLARTARVTNADSRYVDGLLSQIGFLNGKYVGHQRNRLHYSVDTWFFQDLDYPLVDQELILPEVNQLRDSEDSDFYNYLLMITMLRLLEWMLRDLASEAPVFDDYYQYQIALVKNDSIHPMYATVDATSVGSLQ